MESILKKKSFAFAIRIVSLYKYLVAEHKETVISKQILRSGTSIGAMVREAEFAESKKDFTHKMSIALKEANETYYWLELLLAATYIKQNEYESVAQEVTELIRMLVKTVQTSKKSS